jgi:hypothetical protein
MDPNKVILYVVVTIVGTIVIVACVRLVWLALGAYRINRAGPRRLLASKHAIWREPGDVVALDLANGPGGPSGVPQPPFQFVEEHTSGSQPCVSVRDAAGRRWRVKWGNEVRSENFAVRLAWACGYFAETTYFVEDGEIAASADLQRARACIDEHGKFREARFELDDPDVRKLFEEHSWAWNDNPFVGTRELHGLKILVMLLSNWDTKDRRDVARGSNTAIFEARVSRWRREAQYLITDWGGSMGRWGGNIVTRGRWDPGGFAGQTPHFVTGVENGRVLFGYTGQRTTDMSGGIRVEDARWLYRYLGRVTDAQLRDALTASGASDEEAASFTLSLRDRISQLGRAAGVIPGVLQQGSASPHAMPARSWPAPPRRSIALPRIHR